MANFRTHLTGGALVAAAAAFACYGQGLTGTGETQALFGVGVAASLLPDIDADASKPVRAVFGLAGIIAGFLIAFAFVDRLGVLELVAVWALIWLLVRFPVFWMFARLTVHRGIWHSLLMAVVVSLTAAVGADLFLGLSDRLAWLVGGFTLIGYVTHLVLDEIASVDLNDRRIKRSFGTALKPLSLRAWPATLILLGLAIVLIGITPDPAALFRLTGHFGVEATPTLSGWPRW
jgi:hypothetical protein